MPDYPIDLGKGMGDYPISAPSKPSMDKKHYPCLYLDWDEKYNLPESGTMTVTFRKKSETNREDDHGTHQTVELEIREIVDVEAPKKKRGIKADREEGESALDKYKEELE